MTMSACFIEILLGFELCSELPFAEVVVNSRCLMSGRAKSRKATQRGRVQEPNGVVGRILPRENRSGRIPQCARRCRRNVGCRTPATAANRCRRGAEEL